MPEVPGVLSMVPLSPIMYRLAAHQAHAATKGEEASFAIGAVVQVGAALEAFLNEQIAYAITSDPKWTGPLEALERLEVDHKWMLVPQLLMGRTFDRGAEPFQGFRALVKLRNALVHYRPRFTDKGHELPSFARELETRFEFTKAPAPPKQWGHMKVNLAWQHQILNANCARWACTAAREMVLGWYTIAGDPKGREYVEWEWSLNFLEGKERLELPSGVVSFEVKPDTVGLLDLEKMQPVQAPAEKPPGSSGGK